MKALTVLLAVALSSTVRGQQRFTGSAAIDNAVREAIQAKQLPGAVVSIGQPGKVLHRRAYGSRALVPAVEPMTVDTIFDAASLTKVIATSTSIMKLFEQGRLRLSDPVTVYLPEFQNGKSDITIRQLMTHFSGLRPDLDLEPAWSGYETGIQKALVDKPVADPGQQFIYSDINFILLGEIVRRLSGQTLPDYASEHVFRPLGMTETMFQPPARLRPRIAPTEVVRSSPLRGVVHDPTTRYMGGVAGHAGVFTTATDLSTYAEMILGGGLRDGVRILEAATVRKMTEPASPADQTTLRGLGWDIDSRFSSNRGEIFPFGSFGHTGFTGTSLWIDTSTSTYVVLLSNSIHPRNRGPINSLRSKVATVAAVQVGSLPARTTLTTYNETLVGVRRPAARNADVLTGLDVLVENGFDALRGKRVGVITNHTGITREGRRNLDVIKEAGVDLAAIFSPEHGITGKLDEETIKSSRDERTGVPIHSLYDGNKRRPDANLLQGIDVLVFDIQDIGARYYTYMCTLKNAMEQAAKAGLEVIVLDRPNPINGAQVEGPILQKEFRSFVGCASLPLRHGMTIGEIGALINGEENIGAKLKVVTMQNWERGDWWDSTGLPWVDPSPNMRNLNAAILFPGVAMLEYSRNYSVGRGTETPFEQVGAEWIDGRKLAGYLNSRGIPGIRVYPVRMRPASSNLAGKEVSGVRFVITDRDRFPPVLFGMELASGLEKLFPGHLKVSVNARLIGHRQIMDSIAEGRDARSALNRTQEELDAFLAVRKKYLLY